MGEGRRKKKDTTLNGVLAGLVVPLIVFMIIYLIRYREIVFSDFFAGLWEMKMLFKILSLCGFLNLLIFFYFYKLKMDNAARGVIAATFFYAFVVFAGKLF